LILVYVFVVLLVGTAALFSVLVFKVKEAKRTSKSPNCCSCGSHALHISSPHGLGDQLLANWHCVPYRCEVCYRRQYRFDRAYGPARDE